MALTRRIYFKNSYPILLFDWFLLNILECKYMATKKAASKPAKKTVKRKTDKKSAKK